MQSPWSIGNGRLSMNWDLQACSYGLFLLRLSLVSFTLTKRVPASYFGLRPGMLPFLFFCPANIVVSKVWDRNQFRSLCRFVLLKCRFNFYFKTNKLIGIKRNKLRELVCTVGLPDKFCWTRVPHGWTVQLVPVAISSEFRDESAS